MEITETGGKFENRGEFGGTGCKFENRVELHDCYCFLVLVTSLTCRVEIAICLFPPGPITIAKAGGNSHFVTIFYELVKILLGAFIKDASVAPT